MKKFKSAANNVQGHAARRKNKEATIDLMPCFMVHIARLLDSDGKSAYDHYVKVPTELLAGITELTCTLDYPIEEPHTFKIPLDKREFGGITYIDVDSLCMAVAKEYEVLKRTRGFIFHVLSDLWIEGMKIKGNELIVFIGS